MAVTSKSVQPAEQPKSSATERPPTAPAAEQTTTVVPAKEDVTIEFDGHNCVVADGTRHMGRALPGKKICSAHEMHYLPDGTPRAARAAAQAAQARDE